MLKTRKSVMLANSVALIIVSGITEATAANFNKIPRIAKVTITTSADGSQVTLDILKGVPPAGCTAKPIDPACPRINYTFYPWDQFQSEARRGIYVSGIDAATSQPTSFNAHWSMTDRQGMVDVFPYLFHAPDGASIRLNCDNTPASFEGQHVCYINNYY